MKGKKHTLIVISSSSSDEEEEESSDESESEEEVFDHQDDDDSVEETSPSTSCSEDEDDDDDGSESDNQDDEEDETCVSDDLDIDNNDNQSTCDTVIRLLRERGDLQELNLAECKAYLRSLGLRLSGTKAECIHRIKEHWRLKDGNGDALYPRSSFTINCTGDVCKGDVVLFTQKVFEKFDKVTRRGNVLGKRTIAGRIVKESYGAAKQQHTFTVEALWSKGIKKLPPLFPLLVKGRNLYKLKTFRQCWKNEAERSKVLAEKHKRGAAARAMKRKKMSCISGGAKRQKHFHQTRPSQVRQGAKQEERKRVDKRGKAQARDIKSNNHRQKPRNMNSKQNTKQRSPISYVRHQNFTHPIRGTDPKLQSLAYPPHNFRPSWSEFHNQRAPFPFPPCEWGATSSTMRFSHFRPYAGSSVLHASEPTLSNHGPYSQYAYSRPTYGFEPRNVNRLPVHMPLHPYSFRTEMYERRNY